MKLNKPWKYERAINNMCEMESFLLLHNLPDSISGWGAKIQQDMWYDRQKKKKKMAISQKLLEKDD